MNESLGSFKPPQCESTRTVDPRWVTSLASAILIAVLAPLGVDAGSLSDKQPVAAPHGYFALHKPALLPVAAPGDTTAEHSAVKCADVPAVMRQLFVDHLGVPIEKLTDNARVIDDLGADELDTVELVMAVEEKFGVEISDQAAEKLQTVGDLIAFVQNANACKK